MDGNLSSAILSPKQQKSNRLDALSARIAKNKLQANGAVFAENRSPPKSIKMEGAGMCLDCGCTTSGSDICESCSVTHPHAMSQVRSGVCLVCPLCSNLVINPGGARVCTSCKKFVHRDCDRSDPGLEEFTCSACRRSPLVGDVMLAANAPASPLAADCGPGHAPPSVEPSTSLTLNPFRSTSPVAQASSVPDFSVDVYNLSEGISSPATTSDSARNSPFYPENSPSDVDEDFVPGRGGYRGRGGKKKPGRGQGLMKTRSGGKPPSGVFSDKLSTRGKRGKRGANKMTNGKGPGRGRGRGRGSSMAGTLAGHLNHNTNTVLQQILLQQQQQHQQQQQLQMQQQQSLVREVDQSMLDDRGDKAEADAEYVRTIVVCDSSDQFLNKACLCLVCGSVGKDSESSMVACSNCAQTYHTYCVGLHDKLNPAVVCRGWRCLDCTVCEGCGEGKDESKLLLCEECDVSFHIYCLDPPLDRIPNGPWRCKWCSRCRKCNVRVSSGTELTKEGLCMPCHSLRKCPKCAKLYQLGDKIIKCSQCARWYHGTCEDLYNDEMLESASANKMRCSACRPSARNLSSIMGLGDAANMIVCDSVALYRTADEILQSRFMPNLFRPNPLDYGYRSDSFDHYTTMDDDYSISDELEMMTSGRGRGMGRGGGPGRRVPKLGVGGFYVRIPRHRALTTDDDQLDDDGNKKLKRPRKPRRSQLEDAYPPAIQEGFFGSRPVEGKTLLDSVMEDPRLGGEVERGTRPQPPGGCELSAEASEKLSNDLTEENILENVDLSEVNMNLDDMDFSNWMDEDGDGDFADSLNDAMDFVKGEGFDIGVGANPSSSTQATTFPTDASMSMASTSSVSSMPIAYSTTAGSVHSLSRSSSQMETSEKNNPTTERSNPDPHTFRWEEDEPLGPMSTKAAVLYANVKHPGLKEQYPDWNERVKQIQRLWRTLGSEDRQLFVTKARENRASRGKQPKTRKICSSNSVDSPTTQSPVPQQYYRPSMMSPMDERFKVPNMPPGVAMGAPGSSQMRPAPEFYQQQQQQQQQTVEPPPPQQIKVFNHLTIQLYEQYQALQKRSEDLRSSQDILENELNRMRKQKKNLAAKKRQMMKSAGLDAEGKQVVVDLNALDSQQLEQLQQVIPARQKDLETCKRDIKQHHATVYEFEHKNEIIRTMPTDPNEVLRLQQMQNRAAAGGGPVPMPAHPAHAAMHHMGPHPGHPGHGHHILPAGHPGGPPQGPGFSGGPHPHMHQYQPMRVPQQVPYGMIQPPSLSGMQMRPPALHQLRSLRSNALGGQIFERLQTDLERQVYDCVDKLVFDVCQLEDGIHDRMGVDRNSVMLKRLLEPSSSHSLAALHGGPGGPGPGSQLMELEQPRPKKKRTQPKKPGTQQGNEYELMVQKVQTQLRLCEPLPREAMEPAARNPGASFAYIGISDLPDRPNKRAMRGYDIGDMSLAFVDDFFKSDQRGPKCLISQSPSMIDVCLLPSPKQQHAHDLLARLQQVQPPSAELLETFADQEDLAFGSFDLMEAMYNITGRHTVSKHWRTVSKIPETGPPPLEPQRSLFHVERPTVDDVEVSVVLRADQKGDVAAALDQLRQMLGMEEEIKYEMDTPPRSPDRHIGEAEAGRICVKREPLETKPCTSAGGTRCRACDATMHTAKVQSTMSQLGLTPSDDGKDDSACFCSMKCYYQFVAASKVALSPDQLTQAESHVDEETLAKLRQISAESFAKCINQGKVMPAAPALPTDALLTSPRDTRSIMDEGKQRDNLQVIRVADLAALQEVSTRREASAGPNMDWQVFSKETLNPFLQLQANKQELALSLKMGVTPAPVELDRRVCVLCGGIGDGESSVCGRLLNMGANLWVHVNCAIWSAEVYENPSGGLLHVDRAVVRASTERCLLCGRVGASVQCHKADCETHFHLPCARRIGKFVKDRTFFCPKHHEISPDLLVHHLDALRRIFIERNETEILSKMFELTDGPRLCMRLGALSFYSVGQLLPDQLKAFHNTNYIFPNGFTVSRWFWSPSDPRSRILFSCTIKDRGHAPLFVVSNDTATPAIRFEAESATAAWQEVLSGVEKARRRTDLLRFFPAAIHGETLFGLTESAVSKITESLPGIDGLFTYTFRHPNSPLLDLPLAENPSGCARCEPRFRTLIKHKQRAIVSGAVSDQKPSSSQQSNRDNCLMEARTRGGAKAPSSFTDELAAAQMKLMLQGAGMGADWAAILGGRCEPLTSNSQSYSMYQRMRKEWRQTVYLARSKIQGLGLYARRDINMGDMIIEYKGEVIRSEVGDVREKRYDAQNRGVYMFRIDEELIVDATMAGGPARYINHSCDPNCSTRILAAGQYPEDKKIIITANRPIKAGEELTYDYQFEVEDDLTKIACLCGAPNCAKWMN